MLEENRASWIFLGVMIIIYLILFFINKPLLFNSLTLFVSIISKIIPIFILIFGLMILVNYYVTPKTAARYLGKASGAKRWVAAIIGGIISTGPIYMWYPMLKELKEKGVSYGFIATFLYNRAIKPPLIPLMVYYFGLKFTIVLTIVMIIFSIGQGMLIEKVMR